VSLAGMWWSLAEVRRWVPRRFGGRDFLWWAHETGSLDGRFDSLPAPEARLSAPQSRAAVADTTFLCVPSRPVA
jgi:hypothetical protein